MTVYILIKEPMRCAEGEPCDLGNHAAVREVLRKSFPSIHLPDNSTVGVDIINNATVTFDIPEDQDPVITVTMAVSDHRQAGPMMHAIWEHSNWTVVELSPDGRQLKHLRGPDDVGTNM